MKELSVKLQAKPFPPKLIRQFIYQNNYFSYLNINLYIVNLYTDKNWDWSAISSNQNITWDIVKKYECIKWDYSCLSVHPNIKWEIIQAESDKPRDYQILFNNPNINLHIIEIYIKTILKTMLKI